MRQDEWLANAVSQACGISPQAHTRMKWLKNFQYGDRIRSEGFAATQGAAAGAAFKRPTAPYGRVSGALNQQEDADGQAES